MSAAKAALGEWLSRKPGGLGEYVLVLGGAVAMAVLLLTARLTYSEESAQLGHVVTALSFLAIVLIAILGGARLRQKYARKAKGKRWRLFLGLTDVVVGALLIVGFLPFFLGEMQGLSPLGAFVLGAWLTGFAFGAWGGGALVPMLADWHRARLAQRAREPGSGGGG